MRICRDQVVKCLLKNKWNLCVSLSQKGKSYYYFQWTPFILIRFLVLFRGPSIRQRWQEPRPCEYYTSNPDSKRWLLSWSWMDLELLYFIGCVQASTQTDAMRVPIYRRRQMKNKSVLCRPFTTDQETFCQLSETSIESSGNYHQFRC